MAGKNFPEGCPLNSRWPQLTLLAKGCISGCSGSEEVPVVVMEPVDSYGYGPVSTGSQKVCGAAPIEAQLALNEVLVTEETGSTAVRRFVEFQS